MSSLTSSDTSQPHAGRPPVALTIAGSDPSGGAGIQADLKTFSALGCFGTSVVTALTAQNTTGVTGVHAVPIEFVRLQLDTLLDDVQVDVVKIGMLGTAALVETVGAFLAPGGRLDRVPAVLDPVMVATSGARLLDEDAIDAVRSLLPHVDVITPNLPEAGALTGTDTARTLAAMAEQIEALGDLGARRVMLKGGHVDDGHEAVDLWRNGNGSASVRTLTAPRVSTENTHGTGCTLSSAIAAGYARSLLAGEPSWDAAVLEAKSWLTAALSRADELSVGRGHGPVHHFHEFTDRWPARSVPNGPAV